MKKNKSMKKILILLAIVLVVAIGIIFYCVKEINDYSTYTDDLVSELESNSLVVYVAKEEGIKAGETLEDGVNVMKQSVYTSLPKTSYMQEEDLGMLALVDIDADTPVLKNMISEININNDTRQYELSVVSLMTDQAENDFVDVRILFPNGEDYIVLPKKQVTNLNLENCVFDTYLSEEEILRMSSAIIDAFSISGTKLYCTRYVESSLQDEARPTYVVRTENIDLISKSPNVLSVAEQTLNRTARIELEARLSGLSPEQLSAVVAGNNLTDTAKNSVLLNNFNDADALLEDGEEPVDETDDGITVEEVEE